MQVEVQMADHELSANDAIFEAHFAVKMGEIIVTSKILQVVWKVHKLHLFLIPLQHLRRSMLVERLMINSGECKTNEETSWLMSIIQRQQIQMQYSMLSKIVLFFNVSITNKMYISSIGRKFILRPSFGMALSPKLKAGQPKYESLHQNTSNTSKVKMTLRLITLCKVYQLTL